MRDVPYAFFGAVVMIVVIVLASSACQSPNASIGLSESCDTKIIVDKQCNH